MHKTCDITFDVCERAWVWMYGCVDVWICDFACVHTFIHECLHACRVISFASSSYGAQSSDCRLSIAHDSSAGIFGMSAHTGNWDTAHAHNQQTLTRLDLLAQNGR